MKLGSLSLFILFFFYSSLPAQETINLEDLQPTFEEESEKIENERDQNFIKIKSRKKIDTKNNTPIVKIRALDKITAKTSDIEIALGKKKMFGYLEIFPKNCKKTDGQNNAGVAAYLQVKDLSDKKKEKIFVFNGWTFSSSPTLRPFDHPVYDLWVTGCENI